MTQQVTLQQAYEKACQIIGEQVVTQRLLSERPVEVPGDDQEPDSKEEQDSAPGPQQL